MQTLGLPLFSLDNSCSAVAQNWIEDSDMLSLASVRTSPDSNTLVVACR